METKNAGDFTATNVNDTEAQDLITSLSKPTAKKTVSEANKVAIDNVNHWKDDEDDDDFSLTPKTKPTSDDDNDDKAKPVTQKMKIASANSVIGLVDVSLRILIPLHKRKLRKKFTPEEHERLKVLTSMDEKDVTEKKDISLFKKFQECYDKSEKKIADLPLKPQEKDDLQTQLIAYMDFKGKTIPPEIGLAISVLGIVGVRAADIVTD